MTIARNNSAAPATPRLRTDRDAAWIGWAVPLALGCASLALAAFYWADYRRDNAAPPLDTTGYRMASDDEIASHVKRCDASTKKVVVEGWVARRGQPRGARVLQVFVGTPDGEGHVLDTRLNEDPDATSALAARFADKGHYGFPGFAASLDVATSGRPAPRGQVWIAYSDRTTRALVALPCRISLP